MAVLTVQQPTLTGITPTFAAAAGGGDAFDNNGQCLLYVKNGSGGSITVTADAPGLSTPEAATAFNPDAAMVVGAGAEKIFGPFPPFRFNDASGRVQLTYSGVTTLTIAVLRVRT